MPAFYRASLSEFLHTPKSEVLARLGTAYARDGFTRQFTAQTLTWEQDLDHLHAALSSVLDRLPEARNWGVLLEFPVPRKGDRIDAVLLVRDVIVLLETKSSALAAHQSRRQAEQYALLLHYFHKASDRRRIVPLLLAWATPPAPSRRLQQSELFPQLPTFWIAPVAQVTWDDLVTVLLELAASGGSQQELSTWDESPYFPVPGILEAAVALRGGLSLREIARAEASEHELEAVTETIRVYQNTARAEGKHAICFLTGVPGAGKTLVGLRLAHGEESREHPIHFMSGNGPLVKVLQHLFTQQSMQEGRPASQARIEARTLIENVHVFAKYYTESHSGAPSNHALIFDEAQRAWDKAQNLRKFRRDYSEPDMLLRILERHEDWAFAVALVGGGQEINDGEAGLEEWGRALAASSRNWTVYASPEVLTGGPSTAGHTLFPSGETALQVTTTDALHLRTSNRSHRAETLATWVNLVLSGESQAAASLGVTRRFPIFLSRDLGTTRTALRAQNLGEARFGLVGSSAAARLRPEGLEPSSAFHAEYPWEHWYLAGASDVRASLSCEVYATEFEIQGLELDWVGLCWGGDLIRTPPGNWEPRAFLHGSRCRWTPIRNPAKRTYRSNAYRVLLTRARQGMVIFVPPGDPTDSTRNPAEFDLTADFLLACGVLPL